MRSKDDSPRVVLRVPGNVVGSGRYQHIRQAACPELEAIVLTIQIRLRTFATQLQPPDEPPAA